MAWRLYHRRSVQSVGNHIRRATVATARAVSDSVDVARPMYHHARPLLQGLGVNTGIATRFGEQWADEQIFLRL
jgi:hypothetical protein